MLTLEENMLRNFMLTYPKLAKDFAMFESFNEYQIIITLKNGEKIVYDDMDESVEYLTDDNREEVWRRRFGKILSRMIDLSGIGVERLSQNTGISKSMISRYVNGNSMPSFYNICKIAKELGCSVEDFIKFPK